MGIFQNHLLRETGMRSLMEWMVLRRQSLYKECCSILVPSALTWLCQRSFNFEICKAVGIFLDSGVQ